MIDRPDILHQLMVRNAIRRPAQLPLLDVKAEFDKQVVLAKRRERANAQARFAPQIDLIRQQVIKEIKDQSGRDFTQTSGGRWWIEALVIRRFHAWMQQHGHYS